MTNELLHHPPAATLRTQVVVPLRFGGDAPLVRPHSECLTGDVFGSQRCDCGPQLREALERIAETGSFLLYLRQEGRGIGRGEDERDYRAAAQMLRAVGADRIRLLSNNPDRAAQLDAYGVTVAERVRTGVHLSAANAPYLGAKREHAGHTLGLELAPDLHRAVERVAELAS